MATGLDALSPEARTQYEALIPEIERSVRAKNNARGMFYSGQAGDDEVRAKADMLAKLAAQDTAVQATASENERNRALEEKLKGEDVKASKRNALLGLVGSGVGAATTLGGLAYMNKSGSGLQFLPDGKGGMLSYDPATKAFAPVNIGGPATSGVGGATLAPSGLDSIGAGSEYGPQGLGMTAPGLTPPGSAVPLPGAAPVATPSMWSNPLGSLAGGAAGGLAGYLGASQIGRKGNLGGDVGAGVGGALGGLGGLAIASRYGYSNPLGAGLGALAGSFGGKLLGDLFK